MARLPQPGGDDGTWGQVLNDFLAQSLATDGTLKPAIVHANNIATDAVTNAALSSSSVTNASLATSGGSDGQVLTKDSATAGGFKWGTVAGGSSAATTTTLGTIQLAGDLGGTAAAPTVPGLASKEPTVTGGTTGQYYRGDKSWQTLDKTVVGLSNIDNTSDSDKPISTATQTALGAKADDSATQTALSGKEPTITAGTTSQYYRGDKSWQTLDKSVVALANVDNTSDINKPVSTATQSALDTKANTIDLGTKVLLIDNAAALPAGTPAGVIVVVKA